jgi:cytochrome c6
MKKYYIAFVAALALAAVAVNAEDAKANWEGKCKGCHGVDGKGDTKIGQKLEIRNYSDAKVQASLKDEEMFKSIKEGVKKGEKTIMSGYKEKLTDDEIKALVAYMRTFKK